MKHKKLKLSAIGGAVVSSIMPTKIPDCDNCRHAILRYGKWLCTDEEFPDKAILASAVRADFEGCGPLGAWFEPRAK